MTTFSDNILKGASAVYGDSYEIDCVHAEHLIFTGQTADCSVEPSPRKVIETTARPMPQMLSQAQDSYRSWPRSYNHNRLPSLNDMRRTWKMHWDKDVAKAFKGRATPKHPCRPFSLDFRNIIGMRAHSNIVGLEDYGTAIEFWDNLLESRASYVCNSYEFDGARYFWQALFNEYSIDNCDQIVKWKRCSARGNGAIGLVADALGLDSWDARATLAYVLDMEFANLFKFSSTAYTYGQIHPNQRRDFIPTFLPSAESGAPIAKRLNQINILGHSGQIIGSFVHYEQGDNDFCVPATVGHDGLCIGKYKPVAQFLNQHLIDRHHRSVVILFQDARVAIEIQKKLDELSGYNPNEFVVSAHLGEEFDILPWHYLSCHHVVFVPAPDAFSVTRFFDYDKFANGYHVNSCKMSPRLFLRKHPCSNILRQTSLQNYEETKLLHEAIVVSECNNMISVLREICHVALDSLSAVREWLENLDILKQRVDNLKSAGDEIQKSLPELAGEFMPKPPCNLADVTLFNTFKPGNYIIIIGPKDSGKTQLALSLVRQLLVGDQVWPLGPVVASVNENVCYVDGETLPDEFQSNLCQHGVDRLLKQRVFFLSKYGDDLPDFCENFSLRNNAFRLGLKDFLLKYTCRYVILDNLVSLTDNSPDGCSSDVLSWITDLQRSGICICLLHHASLNDDTKARGNENYVNKARVRIDLIHKEKLADVQGFPDEINKLAKDPMLTVGIRYKYHKPAPILVGNTFWLSLPLGESRWIFRGAQDAGGNPTGAPWSQDAKIQTLTDTYTQCIHSNQNHSESSAGEARPLSPDERRIYDALKKLGKSAKRADIQDKCGWCEQKTLDLLSQLKNKDIIEICGAGKSTYYKLK